MSNDASRAPGPRVTVHALIGRDEQILFITDDTGALVLPGGPVRDGEPVEYALRRTVRDQLAATITGLDFCSVIEHQADRGPHGSSSALAFLFDVTLAETDHIAERQPHPHRWADESDVALLRPAAIAAVIADGSLSVDTPWWAWTP
ncbi:NUDIX domain-containing protein [Amycolatopsis sp. WGS_07]|uniref:NUDIX domain-containing protein n=1 Tax=Amycolatopsis sp. WGS_07 TaxID=3076764 RepID=UPI003872FABF